MNLNFNQNKKNGKVNKIEADELEEEIEETNEEEDEDDNEEESKSSKSKGEDDFKKFIIKLALIVVGGIVLLFVVLGIASAFTKGSYSYEKIETIMINAAKSYFADNPESLPKKENQIVEIEASTLAQAGKMKDLSEYTKKGVTCTGKVSVSKADEEYVYTPSLNCGDAYTDKAIATAVKEDSKVVTSGYGLYKMNNGLVFRGETVNNYVQINEDLWRIVKIDSSNNVYLIKEKNIGYSASWDDRYNSEVEYNIGINNYSTSRIKEYLGELYDTTKEDLVFLSETDKTKISSYEVCTGKRTIDSTINTNELECKSTVAGQKLGLLTVSDYINASIDPNCTSPQSPSCQNYNYLTVDYRWWTATAVANSTSTAFIVDEQGRVSEAKCNAYNKIRPVIKLSSRIMVSSGKGTEKNPYIIK
ncbi:MAG: hypothetical protein UE699_04740 [Bacilli bacterium]|nr:hypothetical protein [Bacilli bacterium]